MADNIYSPYHPLLTTLLTFEEVTFGPNIPGISTYLIPHDGSGVAAILREAPNLSTLVRKLFAFQLRLQAVINSARKLERLLSEDDPHGMAGDFRAHLLPRIAVVQVQQ